MPFCLFALCLFAYLRYAFLHVASLCYVSLHDAFLHDAFLCYTFCVMTMIVAFFGGFFDSVYFRFDLTLFSFRLLNFITDILSYSDSETL